MLKKHKLLWCIFVIIVLFITVYIVKETNNKIPLLALDDLEENLELSTENPDEPVEVNYKDYSFIYEKGEITITRYTGWRKSLEIPSELLGIPVTGLADEAMKSDLTDVYIPHSITKIGDQVFTKCSRLKNITVDQENTSYTSVNGILYSKNLFSVVKCPMAWEETICELPDGVTIIYDHAFSECENLSSISLPDSITQIGENAFYQCKKLEKVSIPQGVKRIEANTFAECNRLLEIHLFEGIEIIGDSAFEKTSLQNIKLPSTIKTIENYAFRGTAVLEVEIPNNTEFIGEGAFSNCQYLTTFMFGENITYISDSMFSRCYKLEALNIPSGITVIPLDAFEDCRKLKTIDVDADNLYFSSIDGILLNKIQTEVLFCPLNKVGKISLPEGVFKIHERAFYQCMYLEEIILPSTLVEIGDYAFYMCTGLKKVDIKNVKFIQEWAFVNCDSLEEIILPEGLVEIGERAFANCDKLVTIRVPNSIQKIGKKAFQHNEKLVNIDIPAHIDQSDLL